MPERFPVRTQLSAVAYLRHMGRIRGLSTDAATRRASSLMDRFELSEGGTALRQLSKGNAQRVGLIQALLVPPEFLILDEPSTGLDELGHGVLIQLVNEVAREGGAVVLGNPLRSGSAAEAAVYELRSGRLTAAEPARSIPPVEADWGVMLLTSVSKRFPHDRWVLTEVDLDIAPGELTTISGPNGAGKSTLLNIIAGVTRPTTGTVTGRPHSLGYVPERFPARTQLSAIGYLRHMGRIRGLTTAAATGRATVLMERFELSGAEIPLRQLSKGNAQRVAPDPGSAGSPGPAHPRRTRHGNGRVRSRPADRDRR